MTEERLERIKENVNIRCSIANTTGIGLTAPDKEEIELLDEIERLNKVNKEIFEANATLVEEIKRLKEKLKYSKGELNRYKSIVYLCKKGLDCDKE